MKLMHVVISCGILLAVQRISGQLSRFGLDDDDIGSPGNLPPGISPPGEGPAFPSGGGRACCDNLPIATPMPELPFPTCPEGLPPIVGPEGDLQSCLPTSETCPQDSACWYNGIDYYCCPMEAAPGYGVPPRPLSGTYGRPPGRGGKGTVNVPGSLPKGVSPPGRVDPPGSLPKGVSPPAASSESSEEVKAPGTAPKGVSPPSDSSEEAAKPPGNLPKGVRPPAGGDRPSSNEVPSWKKRAKPRGLQPPPFGSGLFPNPFTCCGGGFQAPGHLPRNINAPSERVIGYIQFHGGHNIWPPKETGKAKFGGPIKPDYLWFPGHHPHFTNELACCGGEGGGGVGRGSYGSNFGPGRPQGGTLPPFVSGSTASSTSASTETTSTSTESTSTSEATTISEPTPTSVP